LGRQAPLSAPAEAAAMPSGGDSPLEILRQLDPKLAEKLLAMLEAMKKLQPAGGEDAVERILEFAAKVSRAQQGASLGAAGAISAVPASAISGAAMQSFSLEIGIEIEISAEIEETIARLEQNGIAISRTTIAMSQRVRIGISVSGGLQAAQAQPQQSDPLVLDLNGDGIDLAAVKSGAVFDIDGDGKADRTAFVRGDDALLAFDANGNGRIDSGRELFGDQEGDANGFDKLSRYDTNRDGVIDQDDEIYSRLVLLRDLNGDGHVSGDEIVSLREAGVRALRLNFQNVSASDGKGNSAGEAAVFERHDGSIGNLVDVKFAYEKGA